MQQACVEIEDHSIATSHCFSALEALCIAALVLRVGLICTVDTSLAVYEPRP